LTRRLPRGSPCLPTQRLKQKPTFIKENQASSAFEALFLAATNLRGSIVRWLARLARERVVWVSVDSIPIFAKCKVRSGDGRRRQTNARLGHGPMVRSSQQGHNPNISFQARATPSNDRTAWPIVLELDLDSAWTEVQCRGATRLSSDLLKIYCIRYSQPLRLMSFPAQTTGLRFDVGLRVLGDYLWFSYTHSTKLQFSFHYPSDPQ
jgi:hypothetical protein